MAALQHFYMYAYIWLDRNMFKRMYAECLSVAHAEPHYYIFTCIVI